MSGSRHSSVSGSSIVASAIRVMSCSPFETKAMTRPSRALISWTLECTFSYIASWVATTTTGMSESMSAMGPCFISAAE